jgi:hypothetical protein
MGDRISISFKNGAEESVALFNHWGGREFLDEVNQYVTPLKKERGNSEVEPLQRLEPATVMVDFIRYLTHKQRRVMSNLYLGKDQNDGDNSDNGHFTVNLNK